MEDLGEIENDKSISFKEIFIKLILKLLCSHKWEFYFQSTTKNINGSIHKVEHTLICQSCGKIKKIKQIINSVDFDVFVLVMDLLIVFGSCIGFLILLFKFADKLK